MADEPTWTEVLEEILETKVRRIHTAMPGKIDTYDQAAQTADVEPQLYVDGAALPIIPSVPVVWPVAYGDLTQGDTVLLVFCEGDIGLWRSQGEAGTPDDDGRHGVHGAVAIAGLRTAANPRSHIAGTTVLPGTDVRLSEYNAAEGVLRATTWAAFMSRITAPPNNGFLTALTLWVAAVDAAAGPFGPVTTDLQNAITEYYNGVAGTWISTKVRVP